MTHYHNLKFETLDHNSKCDTCRKATKEEAIVNITNEDGKSLFVCEKCAE